MSHATTPRSPLSNMATLSAGADGNRRIVVAAILGNAFEFFDFTSYAFFAVMIGQAFFPASDVNTATLLALAVFGVGFVSRPLGSILIGRYADRAGRRPALLLTVSLMAAGTALIALTPPYEVIGIAAPVLIVLARLLQGAALGGEFGPATVYLYEMAPGDRRGRYTSWQPASQGLATLSAGFIGTMLAVFLSREDLFAFGWRIPFFIGLAIIPVGIYLRRNLPETRAQVSVPDDGQQEQQRMIEAKRSLSIFTQIGFGTIAIYLCSYMTTYSIQSLRLSPALAYESAMATGLSIFAGSLIGGWASDRFGRRAVIAVPRFLLLVLTLPLFDGAVNDPSRLSLITLSFFIPLFAMISGGATFAAIIDILPRHRRCSSLSLNYAMVVAFLGGTAQFIVTWLINETGDLRIPAYYLIAISAISLATLPWLREFQPKVKA